MKTPNANALCVCGHRFSEHVPNTPNEGTGCWHTELPKPRGSKWDRLPVGCACDDFRDAVIEACAQAAHEALRAYCRALGDESHLPWAAAPEWQRVTVRKGARGALDGNTPAESHASWLKEKEATGWNYGAVKDIENREHPCMMPYEELPPEQRAKDEIFIAVVLAVGRALGA